MSMKYDHLQPLEREERSHKFRNGLCLLQSFLQRFCSGSYLHLFSLGLSLLLFVIICVIRSQIPKLQWDLSTLRTTSLNFTWNITDEIKALKTEDDNSQGLITTLRAEVEKHKQQLQAAQSLKDKVITLESKLDTQMQEVKTGHSNVVLTFQQLVKDMKSLSCQMAVVKSNGSQNTCCPINWVEHEDSCYWFSRTGKPWHEAQRYCQLLDSHLVVVNSWNEQNFIKFHTGFIDTWMGLTDENGPWRWVDDTDYQTGFQNWRPEQPDNWSRHGLGGEDCAHFTDNGGWNDNTCQKRFRWVCETKANKTS